MTDLVRDLLARAERLKADRGTFDSHWQELRDVIYPAAAAFTSSGGIGRETPGRKAHHQVFDSTGEQAAELLAAALHAGLTHPASPWFHLRALDEQVNKDDAAARWLEEASRRMLDVFNSPATNFAPQQHEKYLDLVAFGSACMYVEDRPGHLPLFQTRPLSECFFAENAEGRVDTNFRWFELTARQAVQRWGDKAGRRIVQSAGDARREDDLFKFVHAVFPRETRHYGGAGPREMPVASCWVSVDEMQLVEEGGFHEFPYTCPRWLKRAGEVYGRGPGMKALADVKMLQRAMKVTIRGVEKLVDPPLIVADDGVISPVRVTPSGINYVRADMMQHGALPIRPLDTGGRPDLGEEFLKSVRQRIEFAFYTHLIQFARDPQMTATQFLGISEQTARVLAPILARLQVEDLDPLVQRVFGILSRAGMLPPIPATLAGRPIRVEYVSPITRAQKAGDARALAQTAEAIAPLLQSNPEVLDNFDADAAVRDIADILGLRKSWLRSADTVQAMRRAKQQVQQQAAAGDSMAQLAGMAGKAAPALRELVPALQSAGGTAPADAPPDLAALLGGGPR
jgi:hypothetical protein